MKLCVQNQYHNQNVGTDSDNNYVQLSPSRDEGGNPSRTPLLPHRQTALVNENFTYMTLANKSHDIVFVSTQSNNETLPPPSTTLYPSVAGNVVYDEIDKFNKSEVCSA